ncbi:hypothetical protein F2Q70_00011258 [Brassica cretica]|uniref:Uncharacterized protein n=2 Tax=Brassica cretica TaxID=69181 RepID=A0A3N6RLZ4_BRACR|nr:hypothetical protein F2Q68_00004389 [Brassica cretica]KAF2612905.1 hypothetical protein F2Q70_00011258 [Brassica cretica]KAF3507862.1 hypothetical protein F2Q69_00005691 [Brassica cretica]KAF3545961.1 hypothetical protein DY000_02006411 [Brassica cretica]
MSLHHHTEPVSSSPHRARLLISPSPFSGLIQISSPSPSSSPYRARLRLHLHTEPVSVSILNTCLLFTEDTRRRQGLKKLYGGGLGINSGGLSSWRKLKKLDGGLHDHTDPTQTSSSSVNPSSLSPNLYLVG